MNTLFHLLNNEQIVVMSILFKMEPEKLLGQEPEVGSKIWFKSRLSEEEIPYEIVGIAEEMEKEGIVCALRLEPKSRLHS